MARRLKSPTRTISNRGDHPRFIGQFPCDKGTSLPLPFDSLSALIVGIYLEWRPDIQKLSFEPREHSFPATERLPAVRCIPDYEAEMDCGTVAFFEAKYDEESLRPEEREKLHHTAAHFRVAGYHYQVIFRRELEKSGFIDTVQLLRRYGLQRIPPDMVSNALTRLAKPDTEALPLEKWRDLALSVGVPVSLLYHLLYHQCLPLVYRPLLISEFSSCRR